MRDHRKLRAFELADDLVLRVYQVTRAWPKEELYGLTSQIRRAAVSVAANIVEGCARPTLPDYLHFLHRAHASLREVGYYINLSLRLGFLSESDHTDLSSRYEEASKTLFGLIKSLKTQS